MTELSVNPEELSAAGTRLVRCGVELGGESFALGYTLARLGAAAGDAGVFQAAMFAEHRWRVAVLRASQATAALGAGLASAGAAYQVAEQVTAAGFARVGLP